MNVEQLRQNAAAMMAHADGKPVQSLYFEDPEKGYLDNDAPGWFFNTHLYRPKPEPVVRPWSKPEDVPGPVVWLREKDRTNNSASLEGMIAAVSVTGISVFTNDARFISWEKLAKFEYSHDRKTFSPCTVTEETK